MEDRTLLSLSPLLPPSGNFALSNWYLTLPTGIDNHPDTITTSKLVAGYTSPYFYTGSDGAMVFWADVAGVTTDISSYPRSELRETNSDGSVYNWSAAAGTATLSATLAINQVPSTGKVVIGQIHDDGSGGLTNQPLIKLFYNVDKLTGTGTIVAAVRPLPTSVDNTNFTLATGIPLNTQFSFQLSLASDLTLIAQVDGVTHFDQKIDASWMGQGMYFKAGDYVQDNVGPATEGAMVSFYQLNVTHQATPPTNSPPTVSVSLSSTAPRTNDTVTATATPADADGNPVTITYVWKVNGTAVQTDVLSEKCDSFDLSLSGHGDSGASITVTVTPNDGTVDGDSFTVSAVVAIDDPPISSVTSLPDVTSAKSFNVSWGGSDDDSSIAYYDVYVSDNGGAFCLWQQQTASSSAIYNGQTGHHYGFYSRATDDEGVAQLGSISVQAETYVAGNNWTLRRNGLDVEVLDGAQLALSQPLTTGHPLWFLGTDGIADTLTIDFIFGGAFSVAGGLRFDGGASAGDLLRLVGNNTGAGNLQTNGVLNLAGNSFQISGVEGVFLTNLPAFTLATGGGNDAIAVGSPTKGQNEVAGFSGGVPIPTVTFTGVAIFTLDTSAGDTSSSADAVTVSASGLVAVGLSSFHVISGPGEDTLTLQTANFKLPVSGGSFAYDGGADKDRIIASGDVDFKLSDSALSSSGGGSIALSSIELASLTGGRGKNILDASTFSGSVTLDGGAGNDSISGGKGNDFLTGGTGNDKIKGNGGYDTLVEMANVDFTLADSSLEGNGNDSLSNIEAANLTGGPSANSFTVSGWRGAAFLDGAGGVDKIVSNDNANFTLTNTWLTRSTGGAFSLHSIESADLTGGSGSNIIDAAAFSGFTYLNGGTGNDILSAGAGGSILIGGSGDDTLIGNAGRDLLFGGLGSNHLDGGAGENILFLRSMSFETKHATLDALFAFWNRDDLDFAARLKKLQTGYPSFDAKVSKGSLSAIVS